MSIESKSPIDKKFFEQIQSNLQDYYFVKNFKQHLWHKLNGLVDMTFVTSKNLKAKFITKDFFMFH
jgi:hypothetical protein